MQDTSKKFCSIIFDILQKKGVKDVVCSPGSRNVPLLLAAAAREDMKKHFVVDERSAAFFGLGISLVSKSPVALVCTSGTALLNYAPAVAEAYYQNIPLIVVSADRPVQWIDQDDSQTLWQDGALSNYVKKSYSIPAYGDEDKELQWYVNRIVNDAIDRACTGRPGPVHINIHLGEPLSGKSIRKLMQERIITTLYSDSIANKEKLKELALELANSKIMVVIGFQTPDSSFQKAIAEFSRNPNVVAMAETISNLHLRQEDYCIDPILTTFETESLDAIAPDIVISIGGALVSRKLKEYLRRNSNRCKHWSVGYSHITCDPFMALSLRIETDPYRFFKSINGLLRKIKISGNITSYKDIWNSFKSKALDLKKSYIENSGWSELKAFNLILKNIPSSYNLYLSNGTPVRYAQIINYPLPHASYCNRGVSGIDGSVSTAIGGAIAFKGNSLLITGDLSMTYDIGALSLKNIPDRFKIIVMDNQGGGIFRFIPSTSNLEECEEYLCQTPILPLQQLAVGYGWNYFECNDEISLMKNLESFLSSSIKSILKVTCDGKLSASILKTYMNLNL